VPCCSWAVLLWLLFHITPAAGGGNQRLSLHTPVQQLSRFAGGGTAAAEHQQGANAGGDLHGLQTLPSNAKSSTADVAGDLATPQNAQYTRGSKHGPHRAEETVHLEPTLAGTVIGTGRSPRGVALVEPGLTAAGAAGGDGGTILYTMPTSVGGNARFSSPVGSNSRPVAEAKEGPTGQQQHLDGSTPSSATAEPPLPPPPQQQQQQRRGAAASSPLGHLPSLGPPPPRGGSFSRLLTATESGRMTDDEDGSALDVVSVGLRGRAQRITHQPSAEVRELGLSAGSSAAVLRPSWDGGSQQQLIASGSNFGQKTVSFSPGTTAGGLDVPAASGEAAVSAVSSPFCASSLRPPGAGVSGTDSALPDKGVSREEVTPAAWSFRGGNTPLQSRTGNEPMAAAATAAGLSAGAAQIGDIEPAALITSPSGVTRARSFHGVNPGPAGISGGGGGVGIEGSSSHGLVSLAKAGRAATMSNDNARGGLVQVRGTLDAGGLVVTVLLLDVICLSGQ